MNCFFARIFIAVAFTSSVSIALSATLNIHSVKPSSIELSANNCQGTYLIESSDNLKDWAPIEILSSSVQLPIPIFQIDRAPQNKQFLRLTGPIEDDPEFILYLNVIPNSSHLARIIYKDILDVNYFGTRNVAGQPEFLTKVTVRLRQETSSFSFLQSPIKINIGSQDDQVHMPPPKLLSEATAQVSSTPDLSDAQVYNNFGYLIVSKDHGALVPDASPVVQVIAHDLYVGEIAYEIPAELIEKGEYQSIYKYEVPISVQWVEHDIDTWKQNVDFVWSFGNLLPTKGGIPLAGIGKFFVGWIGAIFDPPRTWPPTTTDTPLIGIVSAKIRGSIPVGTDYNQNASEWITLRDDIEHSFYDKDSLLPTLRISLHSPASKTFTISKSYQIADGFNNASRVKKLDFDFSPFLIDINASSIARVEWNVTQRASDVEVKLTTDHPSGGNGIVIVSRYQSFGVLTEGIRIPPLGNWLFDATKTFQFPVEKSPFPVSVIGNSKYEQFVESDPSKLAGYLNPFSLEVVASQATNIVAPWPIAPATAEESKAHFSGTITVTVVLK